MQKWKIRGDREVERWIKLCKMKNQRILIFLLIIFATLGCAVQERVNLTDQRDYKYTMYIGLNDKDTYTQLISDSDAQQLISEICLKYVDGYTFSKRQGAYKNEKGVVTQESSLVYEFYSVGDEAIKKIMDEALERLNQSSILIERTKVNYRFYEGGD